MRILWLKTELLHPVDKGGKIRTYHMLKELKREHHITYLTLDDGTAAPDARESATEYCNELVCVRHCAAEKFTSAFYAELAANLVSSLPYALKKYENSRMKSEIEYRMKSGNVDLVICDFLTPAVNMPDSHACPTVLFQHNVESLIWKRHYHVQSNPLKKAYLFDQYRKMRAFESETCRKFNQVIAVSQTDAEIMRREFDITTVDDVPTGVDTGYYKPNGTVPRRPSNLVFTGSMDWLPNEDAIRWFTEAVLPLIRKAKPDVTLTVVGRNPSPALVELGKRDAAVEVTGRVDDVRPYMDRAAAYIVPIRIGGGTRLKIYEAMAMEQPIISTTIGAEGLPLVDGKHLLLADTAESFAAAVTRVLADQELGRQLGASAASLVRERFGWQGVTDRFVEISMMAFESFAADEHLVEGRYKPEAVQNGVS